MSQKKHFVSYLLSARDLHRIMEVFLDKKKELREGNDLPDLEHISPEIFHKNICFYFLKLI